MVSYVSPSSFIRIWWVTYIGGSTHERALLICYYKQGFDNILIDYLHPRKFPLLGPICKWTVRLMTGGALYGLYEFNTNDIGESKLPVLSESPSKLRLTQLYYYPQASPSSSRSHGRLPQHRGEQKELEER